MTTNDIQSGSKLDVMLGPVQETLLIPLYGRARETRRRNGLLQDPKAAEIVGMLDYDFAKWNKTGSPVGACLRTLMMDEDVGAFLVQHPRGTVVEIGCGLNTRFERLDNSQATWFELDLPDSIALRRKFFVDEPRRTMIAASALDTGWMDQVAATGGPWCFVSEAVLIYLEEAQVQTVIRNLVQRFPGAWLVMDTASTNMRDTQDKHDVMKTLPRASWFRWGCDDPGAVAAWGAKLERSRSFIDAPPHIWKRLPFSLRVMNALFPFVFRRKVQGYLLNRFTLSVGD